MAIPTITRHVDEDLSAMRRSIDSLDRDTIADAIQAVGFECTDCGACCRGDGSKAHVATVFPDEARELLDPTEEWRDVVRPIPYGLDDDGTGLTIEWALEADGCGDCRFLEMDDETSRCTRYEDRPSICRTYPFTLAASPEAPPQGAAVEAVGPVVAHECEGLGREIDRASALSLADALLERAETSIEEAAAVRETLASTPPDIPTTVADSEGYKRPDGTLDSDGTSQR